MKKYSLSLLILITLFTCSIYLLYLSNEETKISVSALLVLPMMLLMSFFNGRKNFIILITYVLSLGFVYLLYTWFVSSSNDTQLFYIGQHLLSSVIIFLYWLLLRQLRGVFEENHTLMNRVKVLEGYSETPQLLPYSEFLDRTDFLITGANRRNELNYLIHIYIKPAALNKRTIIQTLTVSGLDVFRANYDVMSQRNKAEFIIFLQNTTENGADIAWTRYLEKLRTEFTSIDYPFDAEILLVEQSVENTLKSFEVAQ